MLKVIYSHAIKRYKDHFLEEMGAKKHREMDDFIKSRIKDCVDDPDEVINPDDNKPQIHIKGNMAVPVGVPHHGEGKLRPYTSEDNKVYIPTVYDREVFSDEEHEGKRAA